MYRTALSRAIGLNRLSRFYAMVTATIVVTLLIVMLGLASCATDSAGNTVVMTPAQLGAQANTVLVAFKSSVAAYIAADPANVTADLQAKITVAENAAGALAAAISTADVSTAAADALSIANGLAAVANQIPGLPIEARAGLVAFQILVAALQPVPAPAASLLAALPASSSAAAITPVAAGTPLKVLLVPNR